MCWWSLHFHIVMTVKQEAACVAGWSHGVALEMGWKWEGTLRRQDHPVVERAGVRAHSIPLTSPLPPTARTQHALHSSARGRSIAHALPGSSIWNSPAGRGFHALPQSHNGAELLGCSGDRVGVGRLPEEMGPARGDLRDWEWGLKQPEKARGMLELWVERLGGCAGGPRDFPSRVTSFTSFYSFCKQMSSDSASQMKSFPLSECHCTNLFYLII